jgi:hypothetical protein
MDCTLRKEAGLIGTWIALIMPTVAYSVVFSLAMYVMIFHPLCPAPHVVQGYARVHTWLPLPRSGPGAAGRESAEKVFLI